MPDRPFDNSALLPPGFPTESLREQVVTLDRRMRDLVTQLAEFGTTLGYLQYQMTESGSGAKAFALPKPLSPSVSLDAHRQPIFLIRLLGPLAIECDSEPVSLSRRGKAESVLKALALARDRRVPADLLSEWVWPGMDTVEARHCLQTTVSAMRRSFQRMHDGLDLVQYRGDAYRLDPAMMTDIALFDAAFEQALTLERNGFTDAALAALAAARSLYRDDLEIDEFEDLRFLIERERLSGINLSILSKISGMHFQLGNWEESIAYASELLVRDPSREDAHRLIIRSYLRLGQRSQGMRHFHLCASIIRHHFDADVEPETAALLSEMLP